MYAGDIISEVDKTEWENVFANNRTIPYRLDTMVENFPPKCGIFLPRIGGGFSLMLGKELIRNKTGFWKKRNLEWKTGFFFKTETYCPSQTGYNSDYSYPRDTTAVYKKDYVWLSQKKNLLEWQNMLIFKTKPVLNNRIRFNIGVGFGLSGMLKNIISERYSQTEYKWDTTFHRFSQKNNIALDNNYKGKTETQLSFNLYGGTEFLFSKRISMLSDFQYSSAHNKYSSEYPKTENYWFGLTLCYHLNQ